MNSRDFIKLLATTPQGLILCWNMHRAHADRAIDSQVIADVTRDAALQYVNSVTLYNPVRSRFDSAAVETFMECLSPKAASWRFVDKRTPKREPSFGTFVSADLLVFDELYRLVDDDKFRKQSTKRNPGPESWRLLARKFTHKTNLRRGARLGLKHDIFWLTRASPSYLRALYAAWPERLPRANFASWIRDHFGLYHFSVQLPFFFVFSTKRIADMIAESACRFSAPNFVAAYDNFRFRHASRSEAPDQWGRSVHLAVTADRTLAPRPAIGGPEAIMSAIPVQQHFQCEYIGVPSLPSLINDDEFATYLASGKGANFVRALLKLVR